MLGEDDLFDMVSLLAEDTGIAGVIFISTNVPKLPHGPRVKYYQKAGKGQQSFSMSIAAEPRVVASSLPDRVVRRIGAQVSDWVRLNRAALLDFWNDGGDWMKDEVRAFIDGPAKVGTR